MKPLLNKMIFFLAILLFYVIYSNWHRIENFSISKVASNVTTSVKRVLPDSVRTTVEETAGSRTKVYKWQDAQGRWHVSNTPPANIKGAQERLYRSNQNTVPGGMPEPKETPSQQETSGSRADSAPSSGPQGQPDASSPEDGGMFGRYTDALRQAREVQQLSNQRNQQTQQALDNP